MIAFAAAAFAATTLVVIGFQIALASGAPWGELAMGGRFPGRLPAPVRVLCVIQILMLGLMAAIVLVRAGLFAPEYLPLSRSLAWVVVATSALSLVMNLVTPSPRERRLWAPVALVLLASSTIVASL